MANKTLDQLNDTGALAGTETIHVRDGGVDERSTVGAVVTLAQTGMASDAELAAHEADTTSVHGIADTSALLDSGDIGVSVEAAGTAATAVSNHAAATDPHGDRAYAAALVDDLSGVSDAAAARTALGLGTAAVAASGDFDAAGTAASAVAAHEADTTSVHGIADTSALLDTSDIGTTVQAHSAVLDATTASYTTAEASKLAGIEAGADVTDAANVAAAGALMASDLLDEDDMASDSATQPPSQQSVKAYVGATPKSVGLLDRDCRFGATPFYVFPGNKISSSAVALSTPSANWLVYMPFVVSERMTIEEVAVEVTIAVAASTFYVGIYEADTEWQPGTLIYGSGSLSGATTGKKSETGLSFVLAPGRYLACFHPSAAVALRGFEDGVPWAGPRSVFGSGANVVPYYWRKDRGSHSTLPATGTSWDTVAYSNGAIKVRQFLGLGVSSYG